MKDTESTQYLLKLLQTKCDIIREWTDKLRLKANVREQNMLNIIASQADQIMSIANDYSKGDLSLETENNPDFPLPSDMNNPEGEHFGEEQTEGLADLLAGLKDGPKDERW